MMLTVHVTFATMETFTSAATLCQMTGLSDKTVRVALKTLEAEGFIETLNCQVREWRGTKCKVYPRRLTIPARVPAEVYRKKELPVTTTARSLDLPVAITGTLPVIEPRPPGKPTGDLAVAVTGNLGLKDLGKKHLGREGSPSPATAGSAFAAERPLTWHEICEREREADRQKAVERRDCERAAAVRRLLREGESPSAIATELDVAIEYVLAQKKLRDRLAPILRSAASEGAVPNLR